MFRSAVPRNLLLPWIAGQIGVFLPLFVLAEAWLVALEPGLFVDPARVTDWGEVVHGPLSGLMPTFAHPLAALLFWTQWIAAWLYGAVWLVGDRRETGAPGFWTLPSVIVLTGIPLALFVAVLAMSGASWAGLSLGLLLLAIVFCAYLQPVLLFLYVERRLRGGEWLARRWTVTLAAMGAAFVVGLFGLSAVPTTPDQRLTALSRRIDPDARNRDGRTLLHYAAAARDQNTARIVLAEGADPNPTDDRGETPLFLLGEQARGGDGDLTNAVTGLMISGGADLNARNVRHETPLHRAVERANLPFARVLLERGADPNLPNREGRTPLHLAVRDRNAPLARLLLRSGADPDRPDGNGDTPARYALRTRQPSLLDAMGLEMPPAPATTGYPLSTSPAPGWGGRQQAAGTAPLPRR